VWHLKLPFLPQTTSIGHDQGISKGSLVACILFLPLSSIWNLPLSRTHDNNTHLSSSHHFKLKPKNHQNPSLPPGALSINRTTKPLLQEESKLLTTTGSIAEHTRYYLSPF
jgi:hypothetical protein